MTYTLRDVYKRQVVKGGRRFSFSALVVVGDGAGKVGTGKGKATEVPEAIRKAVESAKKDMIEIPLIDERTIPHSILGRFGAGEEMCIRDSYRPWKQPGSPTAR